MQAMALLSPSLSLSSSINCIKNDTGVFRRRAASTPFRHGRFAQLTIRAALVASAGRIGPCLASRYNNVPSPADADPLEVEEDEEEDESKGITKFQKIWREAARKRKEAEEHYEQNRAVYREAVGLDPEGDEEEEDLDESEQTTQNLSLSNDGDDFFTAVDAAVATLKKKERGKKQFKSSMDDDKTEEEGDKTGEVEDYEEEQQQEEDYEDEEQPLKKGRKKVSARSSSFQEEEEEQEEEGEQEEEEEEDDDVLADPSFDLDFSLEDELDQIKEPSFCTTLGELLNEARIVPILVDGDQDVEVTGIQYDPQLVSPGNMFVCCSIDDHSQLVEAAEKGATVIVLSIEPPVLENVKAMVLVEDSRSILSALCAAFFRNPSKSLFVIGIAGTDAKTTTSYLLKSMYEAMGHKTGLLGSITNYIHGKKKSDTSKMTNDPVSMQGLMATMVHNGADMCVMEVSFEDTFPNCCKEVDVDIAVFTGLATQHSEYSKTEQDYKNAELGLFERMVDPKRHVKVVNIDDHNAPFYVAHGNPDVPVVTFSMENREADVYALEVQLSLFETDVLVHTPRGNIEISSGLLGRHNVYGILAAVAVGIAANAPLEEIVQGIEEVDAVPGRCELIDEEQAFAVIVDQARTPDDLSRLLDTVRECGARRLITVLGCEGDGDRGKRPVMAKIATDKSEVSILTSDNPRKEDPLYILDDMLAGIGWSMKEYLEHGERDYYPPLRNGHRLFVHDIRPIAVRAAVAMGEEGDAVVIAGKGHEAFQLVGDKREYLDDREECREALQHVDALHAAGIDTSEFPWRLPESH